MNFKTKYDEDFRSTLVRVVKLQLVLTVESFPLSKVRMKTDKRLLPTFTWEGMKGAGTSSVSVVPGKSEPS